MMVRWTRCYPDRPQTSQAIDIPSPVVLLDNQGLAHRVNFEAMDDGFTALCDRKFHWWLGDFTANEFMKIVAMTPSCIACLLKA